MVRSDRRREEGNTLRGPTKRAQGVEPWSAGQKASKGARPAVDENSEVIKSFRVFQSELDAKHDRHERLVKLSRDVTIESKRVIFLLHRITSENKLSLLQEAQAKIQALQTGHLLRIATELRGQDPFLFRRAVSPGLQEYVEAILFLGYLAEERLVSLAEVRGQLIFRLPLEDKLDPLRPAGGETMPDAQTDDGTPSENLPSPTAATETLPLSLSPMDYILGVADLSGELMRLCVNSVGSGDRDTPFRLVAAMRTLYDGFRRLAGPAAAGVGGRELSSKLATLRQSLAKVERACYMLRVRGSEMPQHMLVDVISSLPDKDGAQTDRDG